MGATVTTATTTTTTTTATPSPFAPQMERYAASRDEGERFHAGLHVRHHGRASTARQRKRLRRLRRLVRRLVGRVKSG
jgi:hypothetical protein